MSDVRDALQELAEQAGAQARPPALSVLRRRRARRTAARGAGATLVLATVTAAAVGLLGPDAGRRPDTVVADAPPSTTPLPAASPAVPVPPGQVVVPPGAAVDALDFAPGAPALADLLSTWTTADGRLVTAGQRRGDDACTTVFVEGAPEAQGGGATCTPVAGPRYRTAGRLDLLAASTGPSGGGPATSLVVHGSAPAGTRTVVLTGAQGASLRIPVTGAGADYGGRAWFAAPWLAQDTVAQALDAEGRLLTREELLLAMGQGGPTG